MTKTRLALSVRGTFVGRYSPFGDKGTQRQTGWKSRWTSNLGTVFYNSRRFDTEQAAADAAYRWFDQQGGEYQDGTIQTLASWYRGADAKGGAMKRGQSPKRCWCGERSVPGLKPGAALCRYHFNCWVYGKTWADRLRGAP